MFSLSPAVRTGWKTRTGTATRLNSEKRLLSKWEVLNLVMQYFGDVDPFKEKINTWLPLVKRLSPGAL